MSGLHINVISPHRDDAAFSLGITVRACVNAGAALRVINCFTVSGYAPFRRAASVEETTRLRAQEDRSFRTEAGLPDQESDLGYAEAPIRLPFRTQHVCKALRLAGADLSDIHRLSEGLREARLTGALLLPLAIGNHIDHRVALHAGLKASADLMLGIYEDLPYACWGGESEVALRVRAVGKLIHKELSPFVVRCPEALSIKRRMIDCYPSQISEAHVAQILSYCGRFQGGERLWVTQRLYRALCEQGLDDKENSRVEELPHRLLAIRQAAIHIGNAVRYKLAAYKAKL